MKKLIDLFNKKYGHIYGVIDDSIDNEDVYKVYKMIKSLCGNDQEIMEMLNKIKLPNPRTASESIEKINAEHVSGEGLDDLIKYVDDAIASQPQISFDTEGNLVVTIGGVTKKFKEITE